jgi:hypothetical protein
MAIFTEGNGSMARKREEDYKFIMRKTTSMKDSGKMTCSMALENSFSRILLTILVTSKKEIGTAKANTMTPRRRSNIINATRGEN